MKTIYPTQLLLNNLQNDQTILTKYIQNQNSQLYEPKCIYKKN